MYVVILGSLGYIIYTAKFDPAYPTGEYKKAVVQSVAPNYSRFKPKKTVYIKTEDGEELVRVVDINRRLIPGQEIELKVYRSKVRGITKYEIL
ncbi:hypothetical protein GCM10008090_29730 [Arenicella chitinivorans]|uniref:Uncharacterized protein n=1 Tax=Arenicella chitinivorans TaxID=1329800 RepID=A0A918VRA2_9GAMM|nr:hypothetical protein [Arenicella chitinivorans]GHA18211.1 hypothetical protein GCM10008090_29730 [Arenicella chitinivorans]